MPQLQMVLDELEFLRNNIVTVEESFFRFFLIEYKVNLYGDILRNEVTGKICKTDMIHIFYEYYFFKK